MNDFKKGDLVGYSRPSHRSSRVEDALAIVIEVDDFDILVQWIKHPGIPRYVGRRVNYALTSLSKIKAK